MSHRGEDAGRARQDPVSVDARLQMEHGLDVLHVLRRIILSHGSPRTTSKTSYARADPGIKKEGAGWRARAYNGGLGAEPPAGSRGRAPVQGSEGLHPLKLKAL